MKKCFMGLFVVIVVLTTQCSFQLDDSKIPDIPTIENVVIAEATVTPLLSYEEVSEGAFIGGSIVYHPDNVKLNQLAEGMFIRFRLDKPSQTASMVDDTPYTYGYLTIQSLSSEKVIINYSLYDTNRQIYLEKKNITINKGESIDLNYDKIQDIGFYPAQGSELENRQGYETASILKFICDKDNLSRSMYMLLAEDYPSGKNPSGLMNLEDYGRMIFDLATLAPTEIQSSSIVFAKTTLPAIRVGDILVDSESGVVRKVLSLDVTGNSVIINTETLQNNSIYKNAYLNVKGTVREIQKRFNRNAPSLRDLCTINIINEGTAVEFINQNGLIVGLSNKLIVDFVVDVWLDWGLIYVRGGHTVAVKAEYTALFYAVFNYNKNENHEIRLFNPNFSFVVGVIPIGFAMPVSVGVDISAEVRAHARMGFIFTGSIGSSSSFYISLNKSEFKRTPLNSADFRVIPFEGYLYGRLSITPYIKVVPTLTVASVVSVALPLKLFAELELLGEVEYSKTNKSGRFELNINRGFSLGLQIGAWIKFDIPLIGTINFGKDFINETIRYEKENLYNLKWPSQYTLSEPQIPQNVSATAHSLGYINLSWNKALNASGYKIQRSTSSNNGFEEVGYTASLNYQDKTGLTSGQTYYYRIVAYNSVEVGMNSAVVSATPQKPATPTGLNATVSSSGVVSLAWESVSGNNEYTVYRRREGEQFTPFKANSTNYSDSTVTLGETYYYAVSAKNFAGESIRSGEATVTPNAIAPTGLSIVSNKDGSLSLSWNPSSDALRYYVYKSTNSGVSFVSSYTLSTNFNDVNVKLGQNYTYKISASNRMGETLKTSTLTCAPILADVVANFKVNSATESSLYLGWNNMEGAKAYILRRYLNDMGGSPQWERVVTNNAFLDDNFSPSTTYFYSISTSNLVGISAFTNFSIVSPSEEDAIVSFVSTNEEVASSSYTFNGVSYVGALPASATYIRLNGGSFQSVPMTGSNWTTNLTLTGGWNTIEVYCDTGVKVSVTNTKEVYYENNLPSVTIVNPSSSTTIDCQQTVSGTVSAVANLNSRIYFSLNGGSFTELVLSGNSWSTNILLNSGINTLRAYSTDKFGRISTTNEKTITYNYYYDWTKIIPYFSMDQVRMVSDNSGNIYIAGSFQANNVNFGEGWSVSDYKTSSGSGTEGDIYVMKINSNGTRAWSRQIGFSANDWIRDIVYVSNNNQIIIVGTIVNGGNFRYYWNDGQSDHHYPIAGGDAFLTVIGTDGVYVRSKLFGGSKDKTVSAATVDPAGNLYITGFYTNSTTIFASNFTPSAEGSSYVVKLASPYTNALWVRSIGKTISGIGRYESKGIAVDSSGNVYVAGETGRYGPSQIDFGNASESILKQNYNQSMGFVMKLNSSGAHLWTRTLYDNFNTYAVSIYINCINIDYNNNIYIRGNAGGVGSPIINVADWTGGSQIQYYSYLFKFNDINSMWIKQAPTGLFNKNFMNIDTNGNLLINGFAKYNPSCDLIWYKGLSGLTVIASTTDKYGYATVFGTIAPSTTVDFDQSASVDNHTGSKFFITKFKILE